MRLCIVLVLVMASLAACGEGNGSGSGSDSGDHSTGGGSTDNGAGGGGKSEATLTTELDLGQAFAEDPSFQRELGPVEVQAIARRDTTTQSRRLPIEFRVSNPSDTRLEDVSVAITFQVLPGPDPEDPPVPGEGASPLVMSPQTSHGQCSEEGATPSRTTVHCELGTLDAHAEAPITVVSPEWFKLSVAVTVTAAQ
jgi:hypothetical protein